MPLDPMTTDLITSLHAASTMFVYVCAGGGSQVLADLLAVPGASRTLLAAHVPYSAPAFDEFLGQVPRKYVAPQTAFWLAGRARVRATAIAGADVPLIGLACTATIATDRPKRGPHHACIAGWTLTGAVCDHIELDKGARDRAGEEALISRAVLNLAAELTGLPQRLPIAWLPGDRVTRLAHDFAAPVAQLLAGTLAYVGIHADGRVRTDGVQPQVLLSGAFNPLHAGHLALAQAAADHLGRPVAFDLSAVNVDKPPLAQTDILTRLAQFAGRWPIFVTPAPTFVGKARLFPGVTFVIGYDTAVRVLAPRYYGGDAALAGALRELADLGSHFLVAGRADSDGTFRTLADLPLPPAAAPLFSALPDFRRDISSTTLRQNGG